MQGSDSFLLELLSASRRRFIIPVYQRNYDWKKANCEQLYNGLKMAPRGSMFLTGELLEYIKANF